MIAVKTKEKASKSKLDFPLLIKIDDLVLLCTDLDGVRLTGVVVKTDGIFHLGYKSGSWNYENATEFNGSITLENEEN